MMDKLQRVKEELLDLLESYGVAYEAYHAYGEQHFLLRDMETDKKLFLDNTYYPENMPCAPNEHDYMFVGTTNRLSDLGHYVTYSCRKCPSLTKEEHEYGGNELVAEGHIEIKYCDHYDTCPSPTLTKEIT